MRAFASVLRTMIGERGHGVVALISSIKGYQCCFTFFILWTLTVPTVLGPRSAMAPHLSSVEQSLGDRATLYP